MECKNTVAVNNVVTKKAAILMRDKLLEYGGCVKSYASHLAPIMHSRFGDDVLSEGTIQRQSVRISVSETVGSDSDSHDAPNLEESPEKSFVGRFMEENSSCQFDDDEIGRFLCPTSRADRGSDHLQWRGGRVIINISPSRIACSESSRHTGIIFN